MSGLQPYSAAGGVSRGTPAHAAVPAQPPPFQRLQFGGRRLLGGCVAWDRASGLLAVELQAEDSSRPGGGAAVAASVAILDPQAPETHFVVHVPARSGAEAGEGLAALLWSPPSTRHMLLAVTSSGVGYQWTMDDPGPAAATKGITAEQGAAAAATGAGAAGAAGATAAGGTRGIGRGGSGSRKGRGVCQAPCVNQWFGRLAFRFQLPADLPGASQQLRPSAASSGGSAEVEEGQRQFAARRQRQRLLCCRVLEASAAAAAWDVGAALPVAGTAPPAAEVVAFYQQKGLEQAFAPAAAAAAAAAAALAPGQPDQLPLHWLRPGLLCVAAVTCSGQLLLACRGRGSSAAQSGSEQSGSGGSNSSGSQGWAVAAPVQLPLPPPPPSSLSADGPVGEAAASSRLLLAADVAAAATGGLLVAASVSSGGAAGVGSGGGAESQQQQEVLLFEVTGPPAAVKAAAPGQQQHQAARLSLPDSPIAAGAAALSLTFLPGGDASGSSSRLLIVASKGGSGGDSGNGGGGSNSGGGGSATTARLLTCTSSGRALNGGLHSWQLDAGPEELLCAAAAPAATCTACCPDSGSLAVLLPGGGHLLRLHTGSRGSFAGNPSGGVARDGQPITAMPPHGALGPPTGLAVSPHGLFAAVAAAGGSAVLLLPLLQQPEQEGAVEQFMLQLAKRCCVSLLAGTSGSSSGWDLATTAAAACGRWGHQGLQASGGERCTAAVCAAQASTPNYCSEHTLSSCASLCPPPTPPHHVLGPLSPAPPQFTQQVVDAAVQAVREEARPQYAAAWGRLKAALLVAAAGASPAAAADFNASSVRADAAARDWMATAADVFEQHLPDKGSRAVAASKGAAALGAEDRAGLLKMMPARYWGVWAADFSCYLTRCLLFWLKLKQKGPAKPSAATAAACDAFTAQQNASTDCLPCIRLLSDAEFYRSFSRLVNATNQLQRVLFVLHGGTKQRSNFTMLIEASRAVSLIPLPPDAPHPSCPQQLQLVQDMAVLLKALYAAFKQAQSEQASGAASGGLGTDTHPAGYAGAWTLVCGQPACTVHWKAVAGALQKLKQQGSSNLLDRVRQHWKQQAATEEGESVEALLDAAAQLGLLASPKQAGSSGGGGNGGNGTASRRSAAAAQPGDGNDAAAAAAAARLLQMRAVALAAAEVGHEVWEGAGQPPLPAPRAADSFWGLEQQEEGEPGGEEERRDRQRQQLSQAERNNQAERWPGAAAAARCQAWERDRNLALGVPAAAGMGDGAAAVFEGSLDVLTGRPLTWDVGISHACADGGGATAELQRAALTPGGLEGWQAAFAVASPLGGQRWKRLRLE
ncbi:hypothetical protein ACK3TF_005530 [Chlorella vulgaris]